MEFTSLFKEEYVEVNSIKHYLFHEYSNEEQTILLYIHGGPGEPSSPLASVINQGLCDEYHMVHYDQRGSGRTYLKNKRDKTPITMEVLIADLYEIIQYLKQEYKKDTIVLLGHSFGSLLASLYCLKYPKDIEYYIGVSQLIGMRANEEVKLRLLKKWVDETHHIKAKKKLKQLGEYPYTTFSSQMFSKMKVIHEIQTEEGLVEVFDKQLLKTIRKSPTFTRTTGSKKKIVARYQQLLNELLTIDLNEYGNTYLHDVYYLLGREDRQTPAVIAESYFERIDAPVKRIEALEGVKHHMMLFNHKQFVESIKKIKKFHEEFFELSKLKFYTNLSKYYKDIFPVSKVTVELLKEEFKYAKKLLDVGCGDGEYARYLFSEGFIVDGIDIDEGMILEAQKNEQAFLKYYVLDMREISMVDEYDGIYCIGNSLVHLLSTMDVYLALHNMYKALKEDGKLVIQILNYDRILDQKIDVLPLISNDTVTFIRQYEKQDNFLLFNTTLICDGDKVQNSIVLNPLRLRQILDILHEIGFKEIQTYDGFTNQPYVLDSSYQLRIVAIK